jgi:hypothetical protein
MFAVKFGTYIAAQLGSTASHKSGEIGSNSLQTPVTNHPPMKATNIEEMKVELHTNMLYSVKVWKEHSTARASI